MVFKILRRLAAFVALLALPAMAGMAADPPPLAAYGRLPDIEDMALSNDGSHLAAIMSIKGERVVVLMTSKLETLRMMRLDDAKVRSMDWIGDDVLMVVVSHTETLGPEYVSNQTEFWHALILPADASKEQVMVFEKDPTILNAIFGTHGLRHVDGRWLAYFTAIERKRGVRNYYIDGEPMLFAVDPVQNKRTRIATTASQGEGTNWMLDSQGKVAATLSIQLLTGSWQIKAPGGRVLVQGTSPKGDVGLVALGKDGDTLIFSELDDEKSQTMWREVRLDGNGPITEFGTADEFDRLYTDRETGRLIGFRRANGSGGPTFYAAKHQAVVEQIYRAFPGLDVTMINWTPDFSRVLVRTNGNHDSGTWYLVDMAQMRANALGYEREAIGPEWVGTISTVEYKAGDGLDLDGILTLPPGREAKGLPLVMLPHGGPHAYDDEVFDWWAQAFASRGYAVFQPNFRGSTNRDEAFMRAGFGQWGRAMQTDISDGLAELAKRGIVDPKRACIVGASYGGYAALAGVTLQQGLYRCAVAVAPVADLSQLFSDEFKDNGRTGMLRRSLLEELGPRSGFDAVSPRRFADRADAPILLIHGRDDTVVPFPQSERMADALKAAGKPVRLVEMREEDHWLSRANTRLQMLEEAVAFVQQHNPAD